MKNVILLMANQGQGQSPLMSLIFLILIFVIFYFFMIRPQIKKQKELRNFRQQLKSGDKVITAGGIFGKITDIKDNVVTLEVDNNVKIKVDINSIYRDYTEIENKR
ncbi:MAG: preprotein translocase subunit YajC [Bacteroidales bacterium]|nr:preprotein translocase subunit YajC [Bacteroidales bacterium]